MTRAEAISRYVVRHMVHHRGQLTVYLRLHDLPIPAMYGDSADRRLLPPGIDLVTAPPVARAATLAAGLALLVVLAIANAAGYRFGVSDQAFYLPSILQTIDPGLYPRDAAVLSVQGTLMVSDEITAWLVSHTHVSIETLFLTAHVASLGVLLASVWLIAGRLASHRWTVMACCLAATLRHRITETGANTFEGYYHPRGLAFACGAAAAAACAHDRLGAAWALVAMAAVLHPTTGLWWAVWLGGATVVMRPQWRRGLVFAAAAAMLLAVAALTVTPMADRLQVMDAAWLRPFASKDYVFPTAWPAGAWLANLVLPFVVVVGVAVANPAAAGGPVGSRNGRGRLPPAGDLPGIAALHRQSPRARRAIADVPDFLGHRSVRGADHDVDTG